MKIKMEYPKSQTILRNRFLYAYHKDNKFIILHHFIKKTQKTPKREIEQVKRNLQDYLERND